MKTEAEKAKEDKGPHFRKWKREKDISFQQREWNRQQVSLKPGKLTFGVLL